MATVGAEGEGRGKRSDSWSGGDFLHQPELEITEGAG